MNSFIFMFLINAASLDMKSLFSPTADCVNSELENCNYMLKSQKAYTLDYEDFKHLVLLRESMVQGMTFVSPEELIDIFDLKMADKLSMNKILVDKNVDKFIKSITDSYINGLSVEEFLSLYKEVDDEIVFYELEKVRKLRGLENDIKYLPTMCPVPFDMSVEELTEDEVTILLQYLIRGKDIVCGEFAKSLGIADTLDMSFTNLKDVKNFDLLFKHELPEPDMSKLTYVNLWATHYNLPVLKHTPDTINVRDLKGNPLGPTLTMKDWCNGAMQGSMQIKGSDGEEFVYSYAGVNNLFANELKCSHKPSNRVKFKKSTWRYGLGAGRYRMIPYRGVAVSKRFPYGTVFFIPEARGLVFKLSNTEQFVHDGYFVAVDAGGLIKENHIDVFVGPFKSGFRFMQTSRKTGFDAYIVQDETIKKYLMGLHQNKL